MLVLGRKKEQAIRAKTAQGDIVVKICEIRGDTVRLGIEAPFQIKVHREEVWGAIAAAASADARVNLVSRETYFSRETYSDGRHEAWLTNFTEPRSGLFQIVTDSWWVVDHEKRPLVLNGVAQSNEHIDIARRMANGRDLGFLPLVFVPCGE